MLSQSLIKIILFGVSLLAPEVVDLKSALLAIQIYEKAYRIYQLRGKTYQKVEDTPSDLPRQYEEEFLPSKLQMAFNRKNVN